MPLDRANPARLSQRKGPCYASCYRICAGSQGLSTVLGQTISAITTKITRFNAVSLEFFGGYTLSLLATMSTMQAEELVLHSYFISSWWRVGSPGFARTGGRVVEETEQFGQGQAHRATEVGQG